MRRSTIVLLSGVLAACGGAKSASQWYGDGVQAEIALRWDDAVTAFENAQDHLDAKQKAARAHERFGLSIASFERGRALETEGHPWRACEAYAAAGDLMPRYKDAAARADELRRHVMGVVVEGERLLENGDLPQAEERFRAADGYPDADRLGAECVRRIAAATDAIRLSRTQLAAGRLQDALRSSEDARRVWPLAPELNRLKADIDDAMVVARGAAEALAKQRASEADAAHRAALAKAAEEKLSNVLASASRSESEKHIGAALRSLASAIDDGIADGRVRAEIARLTSLAEAGIQSARSAEERRLFEEAARLYASLGDYGDAAGGAARCEGLAKDLAARQSELTAARESSDWPHAIEAAGRLRPLLPTDAFKSTWTQLVADTRGEAAVAMKAGLYRTAASSLEALVNALPADSDLPRLLATCRTAMKAWDGRHRYELEVVLDLTSPGWSVNDDWKTGAGKPELYINLSKDDQAWLTTKRQFRQDSATGTWTVDASLEGEAAWTLSIMDKDWMDDDHLWGFTIKSGLLMDSADVVVTARQIGATEWGDSKIRIRRLDGVGGQR